MSCSTSRMTFTMQPIHVDIAPWISVWKQRGQGKLTTNNGARLLLTHSLTHSLTHHEIHSTANVALWKVKHGVPARDRSVQIALHVTARHVKA